MERSLCRCPVMVRLEPTSLLVTGATWTEADRQAFLQGHEILMENLGRSLASRCLEPSDEECLRLGLPAGWRPTEDQIARHRLGTPAWMVSRGLLEVRIALPLDHLGPPYQAGRGGGFFHPKAGTLHNGKGNLIFFHMMRDCCWSHGTISCGGSGGMRCWVPTNRGMLSSSIRRMRHADRSSVDMNRIFCSRCSKGFTVGGFTERCGC